MFINANPIQIHPIINKVKINKFCVTSVLKIERGILSNIVTEVNINKAIEGKILLTLLKIPSNIGDKLKINVISAKLNTKIKIKTVNSCNIFIGLINTSIICIPIITKKEIFSGFIAVSSLNAIIVF